MYFAEESTAGIICTFSLFCSAKLSFIDRETNFLTEIRVTGKFEQQNQFSAYCRIHGTWVPQEVT